MDIVIILILIVINGVFALAEIAIVSSRKSRLQARAQKGDTKAKDALELANNPNRLLSTVQIGITLIGILAGAFGGATIAERLAIHFKQVPLFADNSEGISLFVVVLVITILSLIIGELVPKRLALHNPEFFARLLAPAMKIFSVIARPIVAFLSALTDFILRLFRLKPVDEPIVTDDEIKMLFREGARVGVFEEEEKDIVERTLRVGDKKVASIMVPRNEIIWLNSNASESTIRKKIQEAQVSHFPVAKGSLDTVIGIARTEELLTNFLEFSKSNLDTSIRKALFVPESTPVLKVLEQFKKENTHIALVVDEYGSIQGLVSLSEILEEIIGTLPTTGEKEEPEILKRKDGSYFVSGLTPIEIFKDYFHLKRLPGGKAGDFQTVGGFIVNGLGKIPTSSDTIVINDLKFEIADMDGNRVDKVVVTLQKKQEKS